MTAYILFSPTIGAALNVTLLSYNGTCGIGVTVDTAAVPDTEVFMACLAEGFKEVLAFAGSGKRVAKQTKAASGVGR
jgi:diacylglycerol O-acyltransferase / wax synthase